ncbi:MAG: LysM peptidoglycan-binding domain-containing protein, partial [Phaeodactylibacter sp.]|nr:LysM peptidoglycan-binding domain-containing protein [Phaeodactylibacter sp.]
MKKIVLALFFALLFSASAHAASLYILYDPACMDRLEYVSLNGNDKSDYIVYHVNTSPGVKVILEVGTESTTSQDFPPAQVIKCSNAVFDEKLVNAINSNIERVFMVVKKGNNRYFISPITLAARYLRANDYILYDSPKYRFQFDTKLGTIGENIAYKNPKSEVYFEGMLENDCSGALLFQQKAEFAGNPHTNIELVPEVGIVEERSGINATDAMRNVLRLEKVNGKKLAPYLRQICKGIVEPDEVGAVAGDGQPADEFLSVGPRLETTSAKGVTPAVETLSAPAAAKTAAEFHSVKKGETLYRISKQYNVTVDQIKAWNNKGN